MNQTSTADFPSSPVAINPQTAVLDALFPGFSLLSLALLKYLKIDLNLYFSILLFIGVITFIVQYIKDWVWEVTQLHLLSTADIRVDDEMYNMLMAWIANQKFAKQSRRFVANTDLNSRLWFLWQDWDSEDEDEENIIEFDKDLNPFKGRKEKKVKFTPSFGTHYFWYKKRLLIFKRSQGSCQTNRPVSEQEEISLSSFGRNPAILKELLYDCQMEFTKNDENKTIIYRGSLKLATYEVVWTRCVSRVSRPFSSVILDENIKQDLLNDIRDYLYPHTRYWYSNRGIPYRRGYLLYGPPGTGKSSLSFAIAGYFKLKIYIVSLNSPNMNEETLSTLFSELPKQCVVLLEDIDTAGLTYTRDTAYPESDLLSPSNHRGRISLSALLNIINGVASQEGRVLIMTTNHLEKLDSALIRPGRIDMTIKFGLANGPIITTIFRSIFATLKGDAPVLLSTRVPKKVLPALAIKANQEDGLHVAKQKEEEEKLALLGEEIAALIPSMFFSPAEIQGYFLKYKRDPEGALRNASQWVEEMRTEKKMMQEEEEKVKEEEGKGEEVPSSFMGDICSVAF